MKADELRDAIRRELRTVSTSNRRITVDLAYDRLLDHLDELHEMASKYEQGITNSTRGVPR